LQAANSQNLVANVNVWFVTITIIMFFSRAQVHSRSLLLLLTMVAPFPPTQAKPFFP